MKIQISASMSLEEAIDASLDVINAAEGELPETDDWPMTRKMCCTYLNAVAEHPDVLSRNADMVFLVMGYRDALIHTLRMIHASERQRKKQTTDNGQ